jgi:hypothetical protein
MKFLFLLPVLILSLSCSHFSGVQMGKGERSETKIEMCSHKFFGFPSSPKKGTIDLLLRDNGLTTEHVYTLDRSSWYYLFPFYFNSCNLAQLNKEGESVYKNYVKSGAPPAQPPVLHPISKKPIPEEFTDTKSVKDCEQFKTLKRARCIEFFMSN